MANFPTSVSTNSNLYIAVNGLQTTLAANILATDTTIQLTSTTGFPTTGFVTIDNAEVVSYTGISGPNLTGCTRGADGTTALPHNTGVTVGATIVAAHHNLLKDEVIAIETALGAGFALPLTVVNGGTGTTTSTGTGSVVLSTSPTITSPSLVTPALGTPASGVMTSCTGLPISAGTTGTLPDNRTTATPNATASTIVERDANSNTKVNTVIENFATTVTAAGTTALTASSAPIQQFTGTTTQTVTLPDATTLATGYQITVLNRSTGAVTVNNNGGLLQQTVPATAQTTFTCTNTGSANGTWDVSTSSAAGITAYREDYIVGTALNNYTGSSTVFNLVTAYSVGGHSMVVTLDGDVQTIGATVDYQETNSTTITFNNALVTGQKVSFIFQTATSSGGTVNSGTSGQLAYYPATGPTVSGSSVVSVAGTAVTVAGSDPKVILNNTTSNDSPFIEGGNGGDGFLILSGGTNRGVKLYFNSDGTLLVKADHPNNGGVAIIGSGDNSNASAGFVGEYVESVYANVNLPASGSYGDATSISLTAGDWDVVHVSAHGRNTALMTQYSDTRIGISTNAGGTSAGLVFGSNFLEVSDGTTGLDNVTMTVPSYRIRLSATTTVYAKFQASYTAGQPVASGRISARRVR